MISLKKTSRFISCLVGLTLFFALALLLQEEIPFEDGVFGNYTLSIIDDGDFNIINQVQYPHQNWLSTQTGNHPNHGHSAISAYLFPFYLYQKGLSFLNLYPASSEALGFIKAHTLATIFYVFLGLIFLMKVLTLFKIDHARSAIAIYALSTPFLWFTFFSSTNSNIFSLAYSIFVLTWFCYNDKKFSQGTYFILGIACAFGFAIRIQQFWSFSLFLYLIGMDKSRSFKKVLTYFSGILIPMTLFACNLYIRSGQVMHPSRIYTMETKFGEFWEESFSYALWGPNGLLTLSPIYLFIFGFCLWLLTKKSEQRKLLFFLISPPIILFLYYSSLWPLMDSFAGRHQLDYLFIFVIIIGLTLDSLKAFPSWIYKFAWAYIFLSIFWNIRTHVAYLFVDKTNWREWQFHYYVSPEFMNEQIKSFTRFINSPEVLVSILPFVPAILFLSFLLSRASELTGKSISRWTAGIILDGMFFYTCFTQLNLFNNSRHVEQYKRAGVYKNKVIAAGDAAYLYDDFTEVYHKALKWHVRKGNCDVIKRLKGIREIFLSEVKRGIIQDPIGFVDDLNKNKVRPSYLEELDLDELQHDIWRKCQL